MALSRSVTTSSRAPTVTYGNTIDRPFYGGSVDTADEERQRMGTALRQEQGLRNAAASQQQGALSLYRDAALGSTPSAAEGMLRQQSDMNVQNQMALAAQGRGGNMASAQRQAASAGLGAQLAGQQQIGIMRAQEQEAGRAGYANTAQAMSGNALAGSSLYEGALQNLNTTDAQLATQAAISQAEIYQRQQEMERQYELARRGQNIDLGKGIISGIGSLVGGIGGMMSDRRVKDDVEDGGKATREAIAALAPVTWKYKKGFESFGNGRRVGGIIAQDLEKTPLGAALVTDTGRGKSVDIGGAASLALASAADHEKRMRKLEARNA